MYAHTQTFLPWDHGWSIVLQSYLSGKHFHFHYAQGLPSRALAHMLDSLVRVSRRDGKKHFARVSERRGRTTTHSGWMPSSLALRKTDPTHVGTASHRFLFSNFRYSLTLFSKFFSSFPHGTCSLSVSHHYLALDGIYHPLRAAVPNNSTR